MMIDKLKKLTDGLIIFSTLISEYERLDFKNDALAGVRANYFNSGNSAQSDKTEVVLDSKTYNLSYFMCKNEPLSWKITRNNCPYQSVKRAAGSVYCVIVYGENGIINKRIYFDDKHNWLRTEYYDNYSENLLLATAYPKYINNITVIRLEQINPDGTKNIKDLFPSIDMPKTKCSALVYSNAGMLWYDEINKPQDIEEYNIIPEDNNIGFNFKTECFVFSDDNKDVVNLADAEYLEYVDDVNIDNSAEDEFELDNLGNSEEYSAYDKIEKILSEAHKSNKNLFGEVINQLSSTGLCSDKVAPAFTDETEGDVLTETEDNLSLEFELSISESEVNDEHIINEVDDIIVGIHANEAPLDVSTENEEDVSDDVILIDADDIDLQQSDIRDDNIDVSCEVVKSDESKSEFLEETIKENVLLCEEPQCDVVIHTKTGRYSYYGSIDANNCRSGKGRTVTPAGNTSYEGEYKDDKRDGFGVCYYNEGNINYVGNWSNGNRNGCGVGYRLSDGTMHVGKWNNNSPTDFGARFDGEGNFIDVSLYSEGQKNGKSISFDENGNIVFRKYKNGELVSERIIVVED